MSQPSSEQKLSGEAMGMGAPDNSALRKTYAKDCAVLFSESGPVVASAKVFGLQSKVSARAGIFIARDTDPWMGLTLSFPLGQDQALNEASGFGVRHCYDYGQHTVVPMDEHKIVVKFPRGKTECTTNEVPESITRMFPQLKSMTEFALLRVRLLEESNPTIHGYGIPFANKSDTEVEGWVNGNEPIVEDVTLVDVLRQRVFYLVVPASAGPLAKKFDDNRLPPLFDYPYGSSQPLTMNAMKDLLKSNKGHQFLPAYSYDSDNSHMTVVNQAIIQDVMWLDDEQELIAETQFPAYFVRPVADASATTNRFYVVILLTKEFRDAHKSAWRRLIKTEFFVLYLFNEFGQKAKAADWDCKIIDHPERLDTLVSHRTDKSELVLQLSEVYRKVKAVSKFNPHAKATNPVACRLPLDEEGEILKNMSEEQRKILEEVVSRMAAHRALLCGSGFYDWMVGPNHPPEGLAEAMAATSINGKAKLKTLPNINFLDIEDNAYADAIVDEALPQDRARFRGYLSNRPLGLGLIAAGPGFGKTTAGAAATLAMQAKLGQILCSGPTHVAVDNFASRLDKRTRAISRRYNEKKALDDPARCRHRLVVRAYKLDQEFDAFMALLEDPKAGDMAIQKRGWGPEPRWKLHLSLAFWTLALLRSPAVREITIDDSEALHGIQARVDTFPGWETLHKVARGTITWEQFQDSNSRPTDMVKTFMKSIAEAADLLCTTPANTETDGSCRNWKNKLACGVAVDEAANMNRGDLYCVWGNTLLPCFLFGDPKQLPPTVLTTNEQDLHGNFFNRFANDGSVSPLLFLQASGIPVYRLKTQLRMANGMFDLMSKIIYPDVPFEYAQSCQVTLKDHKIGNDLEAFFREKFPDLAPTPPDKLAPIFVHCKGSRVFADEITLSKRSPDQVKIALNLLVDLIGAKKLDPSRVVPIAPYKGNVVLIEKMRRRREYDLLEGMQEAMTVDSFQGQENDIAVVIMGTAHPSPGPGFTSSPQRLNVMLTRQKCGLIIVGDINVALEKDDEAGKAKVNKKGKGKGKASQVRYKVVGINGEEGWTMAKELRALHSELHANGRVVTVSVPKKEQSVD